MYCYSSILCNTIGHINVIASYTGSHLVLLLFNIVSHNNAIIQHGVRCLVSIIILGNEGIFVSQRWHSTGQRENDIQLQRFNYKARTIYLKPRPLLAPISYHMMTSSGHGNNSCKTNMILEITGKQTFTSVYRAYSFVIFKFDTRIYIQISWPNIST